MQKTVADFDKFQKPQTKRDGGQTLTAIVFDDTCMEAPTPMKISAAERLNDGLVIRFANGKCAFYSTTLLYAVFPQAEELNEKDGPE